MELDDDEQTYVPEDYEADMEDFVNVTDVDQNVFGNVNEDGLIDVYDCLADSATTTHITKNRKALNNYKSIPPVSVSGVGGTNVLAMGKGSIILSATYRNKIYKIKLNNVLYVPGTRNNLLCLGRWETQGRSITFRNNNIYLLSEERQCVVKGTKIANNLYKITFNICRVPTTDAKAIVAFVTEHNSPMPTWQDWHQRFGHVAYTGLRILYQKNLVNGLTVDQNSPMPDCVACTEAKLSVKPFGKTPERDTKLGELTHIDLWGKYDIMSITGHQYYIVFVDDHSRYVTVQFLKTKDEANEKIKSYITHQKIRGHAPQALRADRGTEFVNEDLVTWTWEQGIDIQLTAPYSPSQNGIAERMNRTLVEMARTMLIASKLPEFLWEQAVAHAAYVRNRAYTRAIPNTTPYQRWHGEKPEIAYLRPFGTAVWILVQGQKVSRKMLPKSKRKAFVGFDDGSKSVRYYNAETRKILTSRNFRFLSLSNEDSLHENIVVAPDPQRERGLERGTQMIVDQAREGTRMEGNLRENANDSLGNNTCDSSKRNSGGVEDPMDVDRPRKTRGIKRDYKFLDDPYIDEVQIAEVSEDEPATLEEAKRSGDWPEWQRAIQAELSQLHQMGTWHLVDRTHETIPIANKWVFQRKRDKLGKIIKYKARLVAKGCSQRPGYDYNETRSPVVRLETIRVILAIAAQNKLEIQQMDVKGAYLNGTLKEKVYMRQPEGYGDGTEKICLLDKTLYGLKQSGREWNIELDNKIQLCGFIRLQSDPCVYVRRDKRELAIITVWVDDLLLFATSNNYMDKMKSDLKSQWEITDMGEPSKIVGIEITRESEKISISQKVYIESILSREGLIRANAVATPLDANVPIGPNPDGNEGNRSNSYARLLGELQFIANATRPDITYALNKLASYTANPSMIHVTALKRVLRYLSGTRNYGITYNADPKNNKEIFYGFADAAYKNADDLKSTTGYVFIAADGAITWRSKKQSITALSSTEAEYVALSEAAREACWLRTLHNELAFPPNKATIIKGDNEGALALARDPQFHNRSKHIEVRWHYVRDQVHLKNIYLDSCRDPDQTADVLTKALPRAKHKKHAGEMGLTPV